MKRFWIVLVLLGYFSVSFADTPIFAGGPDKPMCPVMSGNRGKEKFAVDYQGKHILLCCRSCVKKFKRNPEKYAG